MAKPKISFSVPRPEIRHQVDINRHAGAESNKKPEVAPDWQADQNLGDENLEISEKEHIFSLILDQYINWDSELGEAKIADLKFGKFHQRLEKLSGLIAQQLETAEHEEVKKLLASWLAQLAELKN